MSEESKCSRYRLLLSAYLDNEIADSLRSEIEQHVHQCAECRQLLFEEEAFVNQLQNLGPLEPASNELREKLSEIFETQNKRPSWRFPVFLRHAAVATVAVLIAAIVFWKVNSSVEPVQQVASISDFSALAVETHVRRLNQQLPLEIESSSPDEISKWFEGKVNFHFELPKYPESPEKKKYSLEGARLINYNEDYGAGVSYRMDDRLITLLMIDSNVAMPYGGDRVTAGNLSFHLQNYKGFHVITWSHRGLTYALVSDFEERGERSCMVCHQDQQQHLKAK